MKVKLVFPVILLTLLPLLDGFLCAQTAVQQYGSYTSGPDIINLGNLTVGLRIPIVSTSGRGISADLTLTYSGTLAPEPNAQQIANLTPYLWSYAPASQLFGTLAATLNQVGCGGTRTEEYYKSSYSYTYIDPSGNKHGFGSTGYSTCEGQVPPYSATAVDGSGYSLNANGASGTVTNLSGVSYQLTGGGPSGTEVDTNGNELAANPDTITLPTGSTITITGGPSYVEGIGDKWTPVVYTYTDSNGNSQQVTVNFQEYSIQRNSSTAAYSAGMVSGVTYPDGTSYSFIYEPTPGASGSTTGRLSSITLPTGGTIQYEYIGGTNGIFSDYTTAGIIRTTSDGTTTYSRDITGTASDGATTTTTTTVTDALNNQTSMAFVVTTELGGVDYIETQREEFSGSVASGKMLYSRSVCYNGSAPPCTATAVSIPITQTTTTETLDTGIQKLTVSKFNSAGLLTERDDYDYGASSPSTKQLITYASLTNNIQSLPSVVTLTDNSGTVLQTATYGYDETNECALQTTSGLPQHISVSGSRGNLTSIQAWVNTSNSYIATHYCYDDAGRVVKSISPSNNATSFTYAVSSSTTTVTSLSPPLASGMQLSGTEVYDLNTGLLLKTTDPNQQSTTYSYNGTLEPLSVSEPDGGSTSYGYPTSNEATITKPLGNSVSENILTETDAYGRESRTAYYNGQATNPYYQEDFCYDVLGRTSFVSYLYQGSGFSTSKICSGNGDSYSYDAIGRLSTITHSDGTARVYSYSGRAVMETDESNGTTSRSHIEQRDGLGRLTIVCELTSATLVASGSPQSCGTDISGTGYVTTYTYNLDAYSTIIAQGGQSRVFVLDSLGRQVSVTEPESGTTKYTYSYNTTGPVIVRTKPQANQTTSSVTTTRTQQFDEINRLLSVTYTDNWTPEITYSYDVASEMSQSLSYPKGRVVLMKSSTAGGSTLAEDAFGYDSMGRVTMKYSCTPATCGSTVYGQSMVYDLVGDITSASDGAGTTYTYGYTPATELSSLTSSLNSANYPPNLLSQMTYGPNGLKSLTYGNGLTESYAYDTRGRLDGMTVAHSGTTTYSWSSTYAGDNQVSNSTDSVNGSWTYSYDGFNRLIASNKDSGQQTFAYEYDRWGNRWSQNAPQGGPAPSVSFNTSTNQINSGGETYDAAGNLVNDSVHTYTFDDEGRIVQVNAGDTAAYLYNATGGRAETTVNGAKLEYVYNTEGTPVSTWNGSNGQLSEEEAWLGGRRVAFYSGGTTYFSHADWITTVRAITSVSGSVVGSFQSLPFGDGFQTSGSDPDNLHFASLEHDAESGTEHAWNRQYTSILAQWMAPDRFHSSYRLANPQSFNRYSYVVNDPLSNLDPSGLDENEGSGDKTQQQSAQIPTIVFTLDGVFSDCPTDQCEFEVMGFLSWELSNLSPDITTSGLADLPSPALPGVSGPDGETADENPPDPGDSSGGDGGGLDLLQGALTLGSVIGGPIGTGLNLVNAGISLARGNNVDAAIYAGTAALAFIPGGGLVGGAAKVGEAIEGARAAATAEELTAAAGRAADTVGEFEGGSRAVYGTHVHTAFENQVKALGRTDLFSEQSYYNGLPVRRGYPGSVRLDAVLGPSAERPTALYDLKTGEATLTPQRIAQIRSHLPAGFKDVPIMTIRVPKP